jgi:hypothetical protein
VTRGRTNACTGALAANVVHRHSLVAASRPVMLDVRRFSQTIRLTDRVAVRGPKRVGSASILAPLQTNCCETRARFPLSVRPLPGRCCYLCKPGIVESYRGGSPGHDIFSIDDDARGISDDEVLSLAHGE